jgi:hypothetical protein
LLQSVAALIDTYGEALLTVGQGLFADGTAAAPGLRFSLDQNTGLRRAGADAMAAVTGGVDRLTVNNGGAILAGLLTGTAVTQSANDTTAGRLTKVGDFGIGLNALPAPTVADLNAHFTTGFWRWDQGSVNGPAGAGAFMHLTRIATPLSSPGLHTQVAFGVSTEVRIWVRQYGVNAWGPWREVYNASTVVGPVSQASGIPTGAVIERGANANGEFTRFADGTQMCWHVGPALACQSTQGALFMNASLQGWTFPAAFAAGTTPALGGNGGSTARFLGGQVASNTSASYRVLSAFSDAATAQPYLTAIGRWF